VTDKFKAALLRKIADKLECWRESAPGDERDLQRWARLPKNGQGIAGEALRLLRDNTDLLQQCKYRYGANSECERALLTLNGILMDHDASKKIERYWGWGDTIALP